MFNSPWITSWSMNYASEYPHVTANATTMPTAETISGRTSLSTKIAALSLLPIVIICGLFGNGLVCRAVFRYQKLRCVANTFIVSLAVSDLAVCGIIMPFAAYQELTDDKRWHLGKVLCNLWVCVDVMLSTASIWNMCVIALDRCMAITNPVWYVNRRTPMMAAIAISSGWGLSLLLSISVMFLMNENFDETTNYVCQVSPTPGIAVVSAMVTFYIPCFIVVALYVKIFIAARRHLRGKTIRTAILTMRLARNSSKVFEKRPKSSISDTNGNGFMPSQCQPQDQAGSDDDKSPNIAVDNQLSNSLSPSPSANNCHQNNNENKSKGNSLAPSNNIGGQSVSLSVPEHPYCADDGFSGAEISDINDISPPRSAQNQFPPVPSSNSSQASRPKRNRISVTRERRAAAVLAVVIGVFICCWLPFFIVYIITGVCTNCKVTHVTFQVLTWLGWCNSILNPLIYTIFNLDFRNAFRKILFDGPCRPTVAANHCTWK